MSQRTFSLIAGVIFLLIAVGHLLRIVSGAEFVVQGVTIPVWASVIAMIVMGYLSFAGFRLSCRPKPGD
jgi:hypothetical protein